MEKDTYIQSISPRDFITEIMVSSKTIIEELCSTGKSGSLFYYTKDGKIILKTLPLREYRFLKRILPSYYKHIMNNKFTLLPKFLGCYELIKQQRGGDTQRFYFITMDNIFNTPREIHKRFDLKGSKVGREVLKHLSAEERAKEKFNFALKDLDLEKFGKFITIGVNYFIKIFRIRKIS